MISAVITCAGNHARFGKNKLLVELGGKPVFIRTLEQFEKSKKIDEIIVAVRKSDEDIFAGLIKKEGLKVKLVEGGAERYISAYNGVRIVKGKYVLIHDGARPLVPVWLIDKIAEEMGKYEAVMAAVETDTCIKYVDDFVVKKCLARAKTWLGQTPQGFKKETILKAYENVITNGDNSGLDDCEIVSKMGVKVRVVQGDKANIKITTPLDLKIAEKLMETIWK